MAQAVAMKQNGVVSFILLLSCFGPAAANNVEEGWLTRMLEANRLDREGRYSEAQGLYLAALAEAEKSGPTGSRLAQSLNNLGAHYFHSGQYADAEPLYLRALEAWKAVRPEAPRDVALTMNNLAALYRMQGRLKEAEPLYLDSLHLMGHASGAGSLDVAVGLHNV